MRQIRLHILWVLLLLAACNSNDDVQKTTEDNLTVMLCLSIPVEDEQDTRAPGDPGYDSQLTIPTIAYIYFVNQDEEVVTLFYEDNGVKEEVPRKVTLADFFDAPSYESYTGSLSTTGDKVWRFPMKQVILPAGTTSGKFYVVASKQPLKQGGTNLEAVTVSTETDVLALTFDLYDEDMKADLPNIYSTPYNYNVGEPATYYSTIQENVAEVLLYHVATRVDIKWNVTNAKYDNFQSTRKVSTMDVQNLKAENCFIFKPMNNAFLGSNSYSISLKTSDEVGRQWYGRASFYTIPYKDGNYFPLSLEVNNGAATHTTTVSLNMTGADAVFVPWMRVNLTYDEETDFTQDMMTLGN